MTTHNSGHPSVPEVDAARMAALTRVNLDDIAAAWGVNGLAGAEQIVRACGALPARRFAATVLQADALVAAHGIEAGAVWGLRALSTRLSACGLEYFPRYGPVLVAANHPGMTDTLALMASIPRNDFRILAARRPFLELLPGFGRLLIWIEEDESSNRPALREAAEHLRAGGALLTFPAGTIEPDPARFSGAADSLLRWNRSIDLLARLAPQSQIVAALVCGVISRQAAQSRLRRLRRTRAGQDHLGAMLQLSLPWYAPTSARVLFAPPIPVAALARSAHPTPATQALIEAESALLRLAAK